MVALLDLVRRLIDYGKELAANLQSRVAENPSLARRGFGTRDLTEILARIARGLLCASALEVRLVRLAARPARQPTASPQGRRRAARPARLRNAGRLLAPLPPEQIAAAVRHRPIGAVIAGSYVRLLKDILTRPWPLPAEDAPGRAAFLPSPTPAGTGPP